MSINIRFRIDTSANWTNNNPILLEGEPGFESDNNRMKIGDGQTAWVDLSYVIGPNITPTPTHTPTRTPTQTPTNTRTPTVTPTRTLTSTPTVTNTPTGTVTLTPTNSSTVTPSVTVTRTTTPSVTSTNTRTPTPTNTVTKTPTQTVTPTKGGVTTPTPTPTVTVTSSPTPTITRTLSLTPTTTTTLTATVSPTVTSTPTVTPTVTPSRSLLLFNQTDTIFANGLSPACSAHTAATTTKQKLATIGATFGSVSNTVSINGNRWGIQFKLAVNSGINWNAGTWTWKLNINTSNSNVVLNDVYVCRVNASDSSQSTIGSRTGINTALSSTGILSGTVTGSSQTPSAGDYVNIVFVFSKTGAGTQSFTFIPDQQITSPFTL